MVLFHDIGSPLNLSSIVLPVRTVSLYDAMRRGIVYLEVEIDGDTPRFLRGQIIASQSVCF
jgi:hypothetical protein